MGENLTMNNIYLTNDLSYQSLFSCNLIQLPSAENSLITGKLGLRISKIFWLYPVLTVALMVLTLILVVVSARWMGLRKAGTKKLFEAEATLESGTAKAWK